jgi:hypothetical protein
MSIRSTLRRTPVRPVNAFHQVVPDGFAVTLRLLRHNRDPRLPMALRLAAQEGWTYVALAQPLGVSRERVRQLANGATGHAHGVDIPPPPHRPDPQPPGTPPPTSPPTLSRQEVSRLRRMCRAVSAVNGATPADDPLRHLSTQFTAELAAAHTRGVSVYMIGKQLGVTHGAIRFRLGRHGYLPLPPSMRHQQYKGVTSKRANCKRGHPLSGANLGVTYSGRRWCRACSRIRKARERLAGAR